MGVGGGGGGMCSSLVEETKGSRVCLRSYDVMDRSGVRGGSWSTSGVACRTLRATVSLMDCVNDKMNKKTARYMKAWVHRQMGRY